MPTTCLAYAELFGLAADRYSLEPLEAPRPLQSKPAPRRSQADQSLVLGQG
ncbi:MAG: hypothetical protein RLZZ206_1368 [Cyanobacteriota bacterium]|jgi:hypothetical protein